MTGIDECRSSSLSFSSSAKPPMSGSLRSSTMQSKCCELERLERLLAGPDRGHLDVLVAADQLDDRIALRLVVLDHEQRA